MLKHFARQLDRSLDCQFGGALTEASDGSTGTNDLTITAATIDADIRLRRSYGRPSVYRLKDIEPLADGLVALINTSGQLSAYLYNVSATDFDGYFYIVEEPGGDYIVLRACTGPNLEHYSARAALLNRPASQVPITNRAGFRLFYAKDDVPDDLTDALIYNHTKPNFSSATLFDPRGVTVEPVVIDGQDGQREVFKVQIDTKATLRNNDVKVDRGPTAAVATFSVTFNDRPEPISALLIDDRPYLAEFDHQAGVYFAWPDKWLDQYADQLRRSRNDDWATKHGGKTKRDRQSRQYVIASFEVKNTQDDTDNNEIHHHATIDDVEVGVEVASVLIVVYLDDSSGWSKPTMGSCLVWLSQDLLAYAGDRNLDPEAARDFVIAILQTCDQADYSCTNVPYFEIGVVQGDDSIINIDAYESIVDALDAQLERTEHGSWHYDTSDD